LRCRDVRHPELVLAVDDPVTRKILVVIAVGRGQISPPALGLQVVLAHEAADRIDDRVSMAQLGANPAIAIGLEFVADRDRRHAKPMTPKSSSSCEKRLTIR
jgi:hypothetical protein